MSAKSHNSAYYEAMTVENPGEEKPGDVMPVSVQAIRARRRALAEGRLVRTAPVDWRADRSDAVVAKAESKPKKAKKKAAKKAN
jgi:hypothetical protein